MNLTVTLQSGQTLEADPRDGIPAPHRSIFVHIRDSLGVHFFPEYGLARVTNGVRATRCGGVYVTRVSFLGDNGERYEWGTGRDYIPARACFYIGWMAGPNTVQPQEIGWGGITIPLPKQTIPWPQETTLGPWRLAGPREHDAPGASMIEPLPPWREYLFSRHATTMQRTPLDDFDAFTGKPIRGIEPGYTGSRGYTEPGQLAAYCERVPGANQYNNIRQPKVVNQGVCAYRAELEGAVYVTNPGTPDAWHGWGFGRQTAPNDQHLVRAYAHARGLALAGNAPARFDLDVIEADVSKWYATPPISKGQGSEYANRATAHALDVSRWARHDRPTLEKMQMPNGQFQRDETTGDWNPTPAFGDAAAQTMEGILLAHAHTGYGVWEPAEKMVEGWMRNAVPRMGYVPKFVAVAKRGGRVYRSIDTWSHGPDYFPWCLLGILACRDLHFSRSPRHWVDCMLKIPTPTQGRATGGRDLLERLRREQTGGGQVVAALSAMERVV